MTDTTRVENFGEQLQRYRGRARLSQRALADLSTVSVRAVRNLELGLVTAPRRETVRLLAAALRLTAREQLAFELAAGAPGEEALFGALDLPSGVAGRALIGRERELGLLLRQLLGGEQRSTVLSGFAGVGKTQLAAATARALRAARATPVLWVPLGEGEAVAERHGLLGPGAGAGYLARRIGVRTTLLVLDGNDHGLVRPETVAALLSRCPGLSVLETTRAPQEAPDQHCFRLAPLTHRHTGPSPALELLLRRVADLRPGFRPDQAELHGLAQVCRLLDGLPGALEAAATWATLLSVRELAALAKDSPETLTGGTALAGAALEALCRQTPAVRAAAERLADLADGWTVDQAAWYAGLPRPRAASAVRSLLAAGLLTELPAEPGSLARYALLHLVRAATTSGARGTARATAHVRRGLVAPFLAPLGSAT